MVEQEKLSLWDYVDHKEDQGIEAVRQSREHKIKMAIEATVAEHKKFKCQERGLKEVWTILS